MISSVSEGDRNYNVEIFFIFFFHIFCHYNQFCLCKVTENYNIEIFFTAHFAFYP